jgi:hypothetical protein
LDWSGNVKKPPMKSEEPMEAFIELIL